MDEAKSKQVIDDLRKSLAWLDLALATLNEGVLVLDDEMQVLFANDAIAAMVKQPRILLLGSFVWDVLPLSRDKPVTRQRYAAAKKKGALKKLSGIYAINNGGNDTLKVELSVTHIPNTDQTIMVAQDITERLQAQAERERAAWEAAAREAAEQSEKRLRVQYEVASILTTFPDEEAAIPKILYTVCDSLDWQVGAIWLLEDKTQLLRCAYIKYRSQKLKNFATASKEQQFAKGEGQPGRVWREGNPIWAEDVTKELNFPRRASAEHLGLRAAFAVPLKVGKVFIGVMEFFSTRSQKPDHELLTSMSTVGIQTAQFLQRRTVEKALRESEERLRFMTESLPQKIFTAASDGSIDYFNPQWMEYAGMPSDQMKERGWIQLVHPDEVEDNLAKWQRSLDTGEPLALEHRFRRADGEYHWHLSRARAMRDEQGNIVRWFGSNTDIHDVKTALERELELEKKNISLAEQRAELIALNQAKDDFISLASHQLRTPATAVKQYLGMVLEGFFGELADRQRDLLTQANISNERQLTIINDLLRVARLDAGKVQIDKHTTDVVALINDVAQDTGSTFETRKQSVIVTSSQQSIIANIDEDKIRMVVENLLDNASKYSPPGKHVEVTVRRNGDDVIVAIKDEGVGISKKEMGQLFRKFSRLHNPLSVLVGGTGLGLYWAKKIIDLHGGSIAIDSKPGKGSVFTITLPSE